MIISAAFVCFVCADPDSHSGPHHQDSTSGAQSRRHAHPARLGPAAAPTHRHHGHHNHHQTRFAERPHQPAGGQQADQSERGACATGFQERHGGKMSVLFRRLSPTTPPPSPTTNLRNSDLLFSVLLFCSAEQSSATECWPAEVTFFSLPAVSKEQDGA